MKRLILLFIPALVLISACAQPRYLWQHEAGLGATELQQDRQFCSRYAAEQTPPVSYGDSPYAYGWYPFYSGGYRHLHRLHRYGYGYGYGYGYAPYDYYPAVNTYAYQEDLTRACLKGKGWSRIRIDAG